MDEDFEIIAGNGGDNIHYGEIGTLNTSDLLQAGIAAEVMELPEVRHIAI